MILFTNINIIGLPYIKEYLEEQELNTAKCVDICKKLRGNNTTAAFEKLNDHAICLCTVTEAKH